MYGNSKDRKTASSATGIPIGSIRSSNEPGAQRLKQECESSMNKAPRTLNRAKPNLAFYPISYRAKSENIDYMDMICV